MNAALCRVVAMLDRFPTLSLRCTTLKACIEMRKKQRERERISGLHWTRKTHRDKLKFGFRFFREPKKKKRTKKKGKT